MKSVFGRPVRGHVQVELLSAYLDNQALPQERESIDAHLRQCPACRAELDSLRHTVGLLHALPRVQMPRAFTLSEAQVGIRRPAEAPGWFGGLVRGLGAVAAVALVAFVAFAVLRQDQELWNPGQTVARIAPTAATAVTEAPAPAPVAPAAAEAPLPAQTERQAPTDTAEPTMSIAMAPSPTIEQTMNFEAAPPAESAPAAEAAPAAETPPTAGVAQTEAATDMAMTATEPPAATTQATEAPQLALKAAPTGAPEIGGAAMGRGGGGPGEPMGIPSEFLTPEPTPPSQPLGDALPSGLRFAYADLNALWAVDRDGGTRQLVQQPGINTPQLSPDQEWIVYRISLAEGLQLWAVRWEGGEPKLLLEDGKLPADNLPEGYVRRAIQDTRWGSKGNVLSITIALIPDPNQPDQPLKVELWQMDVETGTLRFVNELGRAMRPYYSPDGERYLVLQYGTEGEPEGSVSLHETAGGEGQIVVTFPASPGKPNYDSQVAWTSDGRSAFVAIPQPDYGTPMPPNGTTLYQISETGEADEIGQLDAAQVNWAPKGNLLAYTRYISESLTTNELYLAGGDGSNSTLYTTMMEGEFISWAPKGNRFLYQDNFQVFVGAPGQEPQRLANATSMVGPRWVSQTEIMSLHDAGDQWLLTLRDVAKDAVGLLPLAREAMWDASK